MMFQDPVASLSPRLTVRSLVAEPFRIHGVRDRDVPSEATRLLEMVGLSSGLPGPLSARAVRGPGPPGRRGPGPRPVAPAGRRRRAHGRPGRLGPGRGTEPDGPAAAGARPDLRHHHPQPGRWSATSATRSASCTWAGSSSRGRRAAVFARPAHPYTHGLLAAVPHPDPDQRRDTVELTGEIPSLRNRPAGCEFHTRCPFVAARCRSEAPTLAAVAPGRLVRCHFPLAT